MNKENSEIWELAHEIAMNAIESIDYMNVVEFAEYYYPDMLEFDLEAAYNLARRAKVVFP